MVPPEGFEPSTSRSGGARSNPLSYEGTVRHSSTVAARAAARAAGAAAGVAARVAGAATAGAAARQASFWIASASWTSRGVTPPASWLLRRSVTLL
jgi:hypothetical protein